MCIRDRTTIPKKNTPTKKNTPSKTTPKTAYEFRRVWTSLKRRDWSEKYAYIMTLNSKIVKKLFSRSLEPEVLSDVISNIDKALSSGRYYEDTKRIVEILKAFSSLKGFSMAMMMMDSSMIDSVNSIFSSLSKEENNSSSDEIKALQKTFTSGV